MLKLKFIEEKLFVVLRAALGLGNRPERYVLEVNEWNGLFGLAAEQEMLALVFNEVSTHSNNIPIRVRAQWILQVMVRMQHNNHQRHVIFQLRDTLQGAGFPMMLLKGHGFARLYPNPSLRESGDVDIYCLGHYDEVNGFLKEKGICVLSEDEKHCNFQWEGVEVENHRKMNYDINHANRVMAREFSDHFDENPDMDSRLPGVLLPNADVNALHLMMHTISHLAWSGITLRHLADWTMFLKYYHETLDWKYLDGIWQEAHLTNSVGIISEMCHELLGCEWFQLDYGSAFEKNDYQYIYHDMLNPYLKSAETPNRWKKLTRKTDCYLRRRRKHPMVYGEPYPVSYLQTLGLRCFH